MNRDNSVRRILLAIPETAGDVFIGTGVAASLKNKFPKAKLYFATKREYFAILDGVPAIDAVVEFDEGMYNYRNYEKWGMMDNPFDMVFCPTIITQKIPHWIHAGHGEFLGDCYAHMCNVPMGEMFIKPAKDVSKFGLPKEFITIHSQTRTEPKDYSMMQKVVDRIHKVVKVQVGGKSDKKLDGIDIDLRGKTTPQELAAVFFRSRMHLGLDSFPMHVASHVGCPCVILFGGTYAKKVINPNRKDLIYAIETEDRGPCITACHLLECEAKKGGFDKCIDNIPVDRVLAVVSEILGKDKIVPRQPITISAYLTIKDGIKYGFPFSECIKAVAKIADEVVVVDGGSTDGTFDDVKILCDALSATNIKAIALQHHWDMDSPTVMGDEKTYARQQCTGDWLIQIDADEIIVEPYPGAIRDIIAHYGDSFEVLDVPVINLYGDDDHIRLDPFPYKWRITKNNKNIIHGVHAKARQLDPETLRITMDKKVSDGCEYIYADSLEICRHRPVFPAKLVIVHEKLKNGVITPEQYISTLKEIAEKHPVVWHYSWRDLERKKMGGKFWEETTHGRKEQTHNTTKNIEERIAKGTEKVLEAKLNHPLRKET